METCVFDIEADGLNATKIHCVVWEEKGELKSTTDYDEMRSLFSQERQWTGHNILRYDIPTLERILGIKVAGKFTDTLALSWYLEPERLRHGLADWGEEFGVPKPEIDDWDNLPIEEYIHRCTEDVKINSLLWKRQLRQLRGLYDSDKAIGRIVGYLSFKMQTAAAQEQTRWKLDVPRCESALAEMTEEKRIKIEQLTEVMPKKPVIAKRTKPKKPFKQDGTLSAYGEAWFSLLKEQGLPETYTGVVEVVTGYEEGNPGSVPQIKDWLDSLGWKPTTYKYRRDKKTNNITKIPQVNNKEEGGVCSSVKKLYDKEPRLELLDGLAVLTHRISILEGFLKNVDEEGYIKAEIQGFTNTLRFKHKVAVNLPGVDKPYGNIVRGCLIAPEGFELCGSDMSSLENRTGDHYIMPVDPDYVELKSAADYDPHISMSVEAGLMSQEDADYYKAEGDKDKAKMAELKTIRHMAKQVVYSAMYGVTPKGLVRNTGMPLEQAELLHKTYWDINWSILKVSESLTVKKSRGMMWLYNPVSGFWYNLRTDKDRWSTLNQGTGVYCFDTWLKYANEGGPPIVGQFHDEGIWLIRKGNRERMTKHLRNAIDKTNKQLKLNRELDIDIQFGSNYSEIH